MTHQERSIKEECWMKICVIAKFLSGPFKMKCRMLCIQFIFHFSFHFSCKYISSYLKSFWGFYFVKRCSLFRLISSTLCFDTAPKWQKMFFLLFDSFVSLSTHFIVFLFYLSSHTQKLMEFDAVSPRSSKENGEKLVNSLTINLSFQCFSHCLNIFWAFFIICFTNRKTKLIEKKSRKNEMKTKLVKQWERNHRKRKTLYR